MCWLHLRFDPKFGATDWLLGPITYEQDDEGGDLVRLLLISLTLPFLGHLPFRSEFPSITDQANL